MSIRRLLLPTFPIHWTVAAAACVTALDAQTDTDADADTKQPPAAFDVAATVERGCDVLLEMQEVLDGDREPREWPYEGVYRTNEDGQRRVIPIGYRVGGTAIASLALIEAPGYAAHDDRRAAVERGVGFILDALDRPLMQPSERDRYDVRGWGHIYALLLFLRLDEKDLVPEQHAGAVEDKTAWLVDVLEATAIPRKGGWNYAGRQRPSPFMTAPGLQALFQAAAHGHEVDPRVVEEALDSLERGRAKSGSIAYSVPDDSRATVGEDDLRFMDKLPGAIARMCAVETTLLLTGRGDPARLRAAVDAFFEHWIQLERRRKKTGTHVRPFGVAPYYFMYGHYYVAQAIEMIEDEAEASRQRTRLRDILAAIQEADGGYNDRVFPRSRNYGTAMGMMALIMQDLPRPTPWNVGLKKRR